MKADNYTLVRVEERLSDVIDNLIELQDTLKLYNNMTAAQDLENEIDDLKHLIELVNNVANSDDEDYIFDLDREEFDFDLDKSE